MSSIKLKHSGGNSVIIAAPSSNPASDRTITLPATADGTLLTTTNPKSKSVIQTVNFVKTDAVALQMSSTYADVSGFTISITPEFANSKIILAGSIVLESHQQYSFGRFVRSINGGSYSSPTGWLGSSSGLGNRVASQFGNNYRSPGSTAAQTPSPMAIYAVDTDHNTTNTINYQLQYRASSGNSYYILFNRGHSDVNDNGNPRSCSHLTLMEIAA
jgi:hypothetical protein